MQNHGGASSWLCSVNFDQASLPCHNHTTCSSCLLWESPRPILSILPRFLLLCVFLFPVSTDSTILPLVSFGASSIDSPPSSSLPCLYPESPHPFHPPPITCSLVLILLGCRGSDRGYGCTNGLRFLVSSFPCRVCRLVCQTESERFDGILRAMSIFKLTLTNKQKMYV